MITRITERKWVSPTGFLPAPIVHSLKFTLRSSYRRQFSEMRRLARLPRYQPTVTTVFGKPFRIMDAASFISMEREILQQRLYHFSANREDPRIIDGGANIGLSVLFFKQLYPASRITAFEADPQVFGVLEENVRVQGCGSVQLVQKALWCSETIISFASEGADGGRVSRAQEVGDANVQAVRLRDYLDEPVDFLKLDIEGAETEVLSDCANHLGNVENLFVEYHSFSTERQSLHQLLGILDGAGFRVHIHPSSQSPQPFLRRHTQLGMDMQLNIFAYRT